MGNSASNPNKGKSKERVDLAKKQRERVLQETLTPEESQLFDINLEDWRKGEGSDTDALKKRRKQYKCKKSEIVRLAKIPTWEKFYYEECLKKGVAGDNQSATSKSKVRNGFENRDEKKKIKTKQTNKQIKNSLEYEIDSELNRKVSLFKGNMTHLEIDAVVNAANDALLG